MTKKCTNCGDASQPLQDGLCSTCQSIHAQTIAPEPNESSPKKSVQPKSGVGGDFGEYELIEEVARGGMGVIYRARHRKLNRIAAIKMILSGRFSSEEELQRFHIEAEAAAKLDHPGIVPVYEIGEVDGQAFFAMKFIEGGSLADQIGRFQAQPEEAVRLLAKVVRAVHHAHQRGVLHRDLKPANILVDENGEPLITDLGLAKNTAGGSNLTNTGAVLGTPSYMPPEQASGNAAITMAADIYSLGAIMYELLTGQPPYKAESAIETVMQVLDGPPELPHRRNPAVDRDLEMICMKCLQTQPDDRYSSALALAADLEAWLAGDSISLKPPSILARTDQWFRNNRRTAYVGFALIMGMLLTAPFVIDLVSGRQFTAVYDHFPESERPLMFSFGTLPDVVGLLAALFMMLVLWPALGWLNAKISRPTSAFRAIAAGLKTSLVLLGFLGLAIGWLIIARTAAGTSEGPARLLAEAVWPPGDAEQDLHDAAERLKAANEIYEGLNEIPESQRAAVVVSRMKSDQIASAPAALGRFLIVFSFLAVPVIYGTVIGYYLLQRGNWFWVSYIRYSTAWWAITFAIAVVFGTPGGHVNVSGRPATIGESAIMLCVCLFVAWLSLRRWRRPSTSASDSKTVLSSAA